MVGGARPARPSKSATEYYSNIDVLVEHNDDIIIISSNVTCSRHGIAKVSLSLC